MIAVQSVREVVVGVDGSPESDAAVTWAAHEAAARGWGVVVIHVNGLGSQGLWTATHTVRHELRAMGRPVVDAAIGLVRRAEPAVPVRGRVLLGPADRTMLVVATYAPLTVVGLRERSAMSRLLAGSVAQRLMSHSPQPVAVVPVGTADMRANRIVIGIEDPANDDAERYAFGIALERELPVLAVRMALDGDDLDAEREFVSKRISERPSEFKDVEVSCVALRGDPGDTLPLLCLPTDLLVVGQHRRRSFAPATLGPVLGPIARTAPCPVMVIPGHDVT